MYYCTDYKIIVVILIVFLYRQKIWYHIRGINSFTEYKINFFFLQFLDEVAEIQAKAAEEEKKRLEAELAAKQKKTFFRKKSQVEVSQCFYCDPRENQFT